MKMKHVEGKKKGNISLYALSTCGWCSKTKKLLDDLGVDYSFVDVDLLDGEGRKEAMKEVERWNPRASFPTLVISDKCIVGFDEGKIRKALGL
jgi:glutaredoxin